MTEAVGVDTKTISVGETTTQEQSVNTAIHKFSLERRKGQDVLHFVDSYTASNPDQVQKLYARLRYLRNIGSKSPSAFPFAIDGAIAQALHDGRTDVVECLLTPGKHELKRIDQALWSSVWLKVLDEDRQDAMWQTLTDIHKKKEKDFRNAAGQRGIDDETSNKILEMTVDPESALAVPEEFWQTEYQQMDESEQKSFLSIYAPLATAVDALHILRRHGFTGTQSNSSLYKILRSTDPEAYATSLFQLDQQSQTDNKPQMGMSILSEFQDPILAASEAKRLFSDNGPTLPSIHLQRALTGYRSSERKLIEIDQDQIDFIEQTKDLLTALHVTDPNAVAIVCGATVSREDTVQRRERILAAKELLSGGEIPNEFIPAILATGNPSEAVTILTPYWQKLTVLPEELKNVLKQGLYKIGDTQYVRQFFRVESALTNQGIVLNANEVHDFTRLVTELCEQQIDNVEADQKIENFIDNKRIAKELVQVYWKAANEVIRAKKAGDKAKLEPHVLTDLIQLSRVFNRLGIPDDVAVKMYQSWRTYDFLATFDDEQLKKADHFKLENAMNEKSSIIISKLEAVKKYISLYGLQELLEVHKTFGIVNFTKVANADGDLELEKIHNQLIRWRDPNERPKILSFGAVDDHNNAFRRDMGELFEQVGEESVFYFEVGGKRDIAKAIRLIGDRERAFGRDPRSQPTVQVVRIAGHGSPEGIALSLDEVLDIVDFPRTSRGELDINSNFMRPNTYEKDLGDQFVLVLAACLTASDSVHGGANLAATMNEWYGRPLSAAKEATINTTLLPEEREERVMHWVSRPDKPGPRKGVSRTYPARTRMSQPEVIGS